MEKKRDEMAGQEPSMLKRPLELRLPLLSPMHFTSETLFLGIVGASVFVMALRRGGDTQPFFVSVLAMTQGMAAIALWLAVQAFCLLHESILDTSDRKSMESAERMVLFSSRLNLRLLAKGWTALGVALPFVAAGEPLPGYLGAAMAGFYSSKHFYYAIAIVGIIAKRAHKASEGEE